jgi:hypothetical protein
MIKIMFFFGKIKIHSEEEYDMWYSCPEFLFENKIIIILLKKLKKIAISIKNLTSGS